MCAKQEQENCGGSLNEHGFCDANLTCVEQVNNGDLLTNSYKGICKRMYSYFSTHSRFISSMFFNCLCS